MSEQTTAASSPADVDVFQGRDNIGVDEYIRSRTIPAEPAGTAPADPPEQTETEGDDPESSGESDAPTNLQEKAAERKPHLTAQQRIAQVEATIEKIWQQDEPDTVKIAQLYATIEKIGQRAGIKRKAESAPAVQPAESSQSAPPAPQSTRTKPTPDAQTQDGKAKYDTYEAYVEDLTEWKAEQQIARYKQDLAKQAQYEQLRAKVEEGKAIYGDDFGTVADEAAGIIGNDTALPQLVRDRLGRSNYLPHLMFTIAGEPNGLASFLATAKSDPFLALDRIALTENLIREELATGKTEPESGKTPEPKRTQAPKPPSPVSGSSSRGFDVSDEGLSADEWMRKRNKQVGKG